MQKQHYSIIINAPKEKVWDTMLNDATYRQWTSVFNPGGSWYEGDWSEGSPMRFIGPDEKGNQGGMVSRVLENKKYEHVLIEHLGVINSGTEDTTSDKVKEWAGAREGYTFTETDGKTEVSIEIDVADSFKEMFDGMWPKALEKLKVITES